MVDTKKILHRNKNDGSKMNDDTMMTRNCDTAMIFYSKISERDG